MQEQAQFSQLLTSLAEILEYVDELEEMSDDRSLAQRTQLIKERCEQFVLNVYLINQNILTDIEKLRQVWRTSSQEKFNKIALQQLRELCTQSAPYK